MRTVLCMGAAVVPRACMSASLIFGAQRGSLTIPGCAFLGGAQIVGLHGFRKEVCSWDDLVSLATGASRARLRVGLREAAFAAEFCVSSIFLFGRSPARGFTSWPRA